MITEFAPAKINLALHVTGRREDGYHLLDSAVMFAADAGDTLEVEKADVTSLHISGPFSEGLETDENNLVLKAHTALSTHFPGKVAACAMTLTKALPVASGIGGGSADAAAALRALVRLNGLEIAADDLARVALGLGADVPVCLASRACRMRGIGEVIDGWPTPPELHAVLVNPLLGVSTAAIFKSLALQPGADAHPAMNGFEKGARLDWLAQQRNDLEAAARTIEPTISAVIEAIAALPDCQLVRMSGSGATCFGVFETANQAQKASAALSAMQPGWWVVPTRLV